VLNACCYVIHVMGKLIVAFMCIFAIKLVLKFHFTVSSYVTNNISLEYVRKHYT